MKQLEVLVSQKQHTRMISCMDKVSKIQRHIDLFESAKGDKVYKAWYTLKLIKEELQK